MTNYLHPLNERIRLIMRLNYLFKNILTAEQASKTDEAAFFIGLESLVYLLNIGSRYDLNSETLKELDRIYLTVKDQNIAEIIKLFHSKLKQNFFTLKQDDFLNILKQKLNLAGPAYRADFPLLINWLSPSSTIRDQDLARWKNLLEPYIQANTAIVKHYKDLSIPQTLIFEAGFCLVSLPKSTCFIELMLPHNDYPEFSGNQQRMSIRLLKSNHSHKHATQSDFSGELTLNSYAI
ncbi:cell division protein ZapD [Gammaproteobacteria bacterium]|nr:cell division protein ZapD [Gammaproteobacteria bacterium]